MGEELTIIRKPVPATSPTLRDLLAVVFRQRRLAFLSFMAIFIAILGYGVFAPSYEAHMSVLVRRGRVDPLVTPAPTPSPMFQRDEITDEELNSQVELLRDDEILRTVAQSSGLAGGPWYERFLGGSGEVRLARSVRRMAHRLTVEAIRKTNLIQVDYSSSDPVQAAAVLHALAHAYLERQQRVRRPSGEYDFHQPAFFFHNSYLEIAVQDGLLGLSLYLWMVFDLFRLGRRVRPHVGSGEGTFLDEQFRSFWPVLDAVYLFNGCFVVMNSQFVN